MPAPERQPAARPEAWLDSARSDLRIARLAQGQDGIRPEQVCFHAQQTAEKSIKGVLLAGSIEFPLTHSVGALLDLAERGGEPPPAHLAGAASLTRYAVETRYPETTLDAATAEEVEEAIGLAEAVLAWAAAVIARNG